MEVHPPEPERIDESEYEIVDAHPVPVEGAELVPGRAPSAPVRAAAVAATGFIAGAATMALARRYGARKLAEVVPPQQSQALDAWPVGSSRTYLVTVRRLPHPGA